MKNKFTTFRVKVRGVNLNRIFKVLKQNKIDIFNIDRVDYKTIIFDIEIAQKKLFFNLFKEKYELTIIQNYGLQRFFNFLKYQLGFIIGIGICLIVLFVHSSFVWKIDINGVSKLSKSDVQNVLAKNGASVGASLNGLDCDKLSNALTNELSQISLVDIVKKGTTLIVNIKEKIDVAEMDNLGQSQDVVAQFDGTITSISVTNGTQVVKVGDSVKKGDVLIKGYYYDLNLNKINCKANGEVYAKVWYSHTTEYNENQIINIRTGKKLVAQSMELFGMDFTVSKPQMNFNNYEIETTENYVFGNNILPFKLKTTTYYETTSQEIYLPFEQNKGKILQETRLFAKELVPNNVQIVKEFDIIETVKDTYYVSYYFETEILIV